jgi:hypothetical protein
MPKFDDWNGWLQADMQFATRTLLSSGAVSPMFVLHQRGGEVLAISLPFSDDEEKRATHMFVTLMCAANDVIGFSFIGEAWMRQMERKSRMR